MIEELQSIFEETTGNYSVKLVPETEITSELTGSSFGIIQLVCAIEDHYNIEIPNKALRSFHRVGDILIYLEQNI